MHVCDRDGGWVSEEGWWVSVMGYMQLDLLSETGGTAYFGQGVTIPIASEDVGTGMNSWCPRTSQYWTVLWKTDSRKGT